MEALRDEAIAACTSRFIRVHSIVVGDRDETYQAFSTLSLSTGGQVFKIADSENTETVQKIVDSLAIEQAKVAGADETISKWTDGAKLSSDVQEFVFRGILPDFAGQPIPPTVYVSTRQDGTREVCLYKSKASLYEMLGDMQTDFVGMIEDPSPDLLTAIAAGGVEFIAELDTEVLQSILDMDDPSAATAEVKSMLEAMPELPGMIRELNDKGALADWHALARRTVALSRFRLRSQEFLRRPRMGAVQCIEYLTMNDEQSPLVVIAGAGYRQDVARSCRESGTIPGERRRSVSEDCIGPTRGGSGKA